MIKVRLSGTKVEIDKMIESLKENYKILQHPREYENRGNEYVRVYVEVALKEQI